MNRKLLIVFILSFTMVSCIRNEDLYQEIITTPPYVYSFSDETKDATAIITIKTNKNIKASEVTAGIPYLKYNKSWLIMLTQDDCKDAAYCRTWAKMNGKPVSSSEEYENGNDLFYEYRQSINGDMPPNVIAAQHSLGSTDGVENEVRFSFTTTLLPEDKKLMFDNVEVKKGYTGNYYRFYMKNGLVWQDVMDMMNYGVGIAFHDVGAADVNNAEDILNHYKIAQDSIIKNLGRGCKMLAEPNGNKTYVTAALSYPYIQTMTAQSGTVILYPFKVTTDLHDVLINREFNDDPDAFKPEILAQLALPKEDRKAICIGVHNTDNGWMDLLQWINDNYGEKGNDSVWFPSQEEYYEYNYYRIHGTRKIEQIDDRTIRLTVTLPSGEYFYFPSTTVNLTGIAKDDIDSISTNDVISGLSYGNYSDGIMLNIDCRKHLDELAMHYVEKYEADETNPSNKADAIYFVNKLKTGTMKDNLLKRLGQ